MSDELTKMREEHKKKQKALEAELSQLEEKRLIELGKSITKEMLGTGIWKIRHLMRDSFLLDGERDDFPALIELTRGMSWLDSIPIIIGEYRYRLLTTNEMFILSPNSNFNDASVKVDLVPLVENFGLRLDSTDLYEDIVRLEKELGLFKETKAKLALTQQ